MSGSTLASEFADRNKSYTSYRTLSKLVELGALSPGLLATERIVDVGPARLVATESLTALEILDLVNETHEIHVEYEYSAIASAGPAPS